MQIGGSLRQGCGEREEEEDGRSGKAQRGVGMGN